MQAAYNTLPIERLELRSHPVPLIQLVLSNTLILLLKCAITSRDCIWLTNHSWNCSNTTAMCVSLTIRYWIIQKMFYNVSVSAFLQAKHSPVLCSKAHCITDYYCTGGKRPISRKQSTSKVNEIQIFVWFLCYHSLFRVLTFDSVGEFYIYIVLHVDSK